eukprot:CAMPEP_0177571346 /NCGR_PEP_ID=MMETSP0369-20130122/77378_1 /TAXON_ID=447022 ORGANISM="Scrippsiella hangoei-like, Strain SHHI-4" /NCGR_SAMPLE_ID=MMETSP0369 /ASSEMBLY_ACC=CAM_ASM_000364 /LENGTH=44 /DNA_ID= /DNA_START= /DNA_END= /DNA_ORIENTATION=
MDDAFPAAADTTSSLGIARPDPQTSECAALRDRWDRRTERVLSF